MKKLRIAYLITGLNGGGAETMLFHILRFLDRDRFEPAVISLMDRGKFGDMIEKMGIPVQTIGLRPGQVNPAAAFRVVKFLRSARPDIIQGWMYHANLAAQLASFFVRVPVCWCIQCSATLSGCGVSRSVRTRPCLRERTRPQCSRTSRCCEKEGSAIGNGCASGLIRAGPRLSRSSTERRVGSARA